MDELDEAQVMVKNRPTAKSRAIVQGPKTKSLAFPIGSAQTRFKSSTRVVMPDMEGLYRSLW